MSVSLIHLITEQPHTSVPQMTPRDLLWMVHSMKSTQETTRGLGIAVISQTLFAAMML